MRPGHQKPLRAIADCTFSVISENKGRFIFDFRQADIPSLLFEQTLTDPGFIETFPEGCTAVYSFMLASNRLLFLWGDPLNPEMTVFGPSGNLLYVWVLGKLLKLWLRSA